ncbi:MAG: DNA repair protein RadC [bacterium]|nr:DNA repair protein RadC [bacterium]
MKSKSSPYIQRVEEHKSVGHRGRLRERFLQGGLNSFLDYEIVELLLTLGTPRKDCKPMAKEAIKKFRGLRAVLDASFEELQEVKGIGPSNAFGLKLFQAVSERHAKEQIFEKVILDSPKAIYNYLQKSIGREKKENFVLLSLDTRNNLIKISNISVGTLNASLVHPREVFEPAIRNSATQVVLAHNHPAGNPEPSEEDEVVTRQLVDAGKILGIPVIDHVIVASNSYFSFASKCPDIFRPIV